MDYILCEQLSEERKRIPNQHRPSGGAEGTGPKDHDVNMTEVCVKALEMEVERQEKVAVPA